MEFIVRTMDPTLLLLCCLGLAVVGVGGYKDGPPVADPGICSSMTPSHDAAPKTDSPPFTVTTDYDCFSQDATVKVTIQQTGDTYFEGFFTQARKVDKNDMSYGTFDKFDYKYHKYVKTLDCFGQQQNAIGHAKPRHQTEAIFYWTAPNNLSEDIEFVSTMVRHKNEVWLGFKKSLTYKANCDAPVNMTIPMIISKAHTTSGSQLLPMLMAATVLRILV